MPREEGSRTYTHTSSIGPDVIKNGDHMPTLSDRAFQTRIEGITREESNQPWLAGIGTIIAVMVDNSLKASYTTYRLC